MLKLIHSDVRDTIFELNIQMLCPICEASGETGVLLMRRLCSLVDDK